MQHYLAHRDNKEKEKTSREATGKYFYTLSQTCFAAMVIGAVLTYFTNKDIPGGNILGLFCVGIAATSIFYTIGYYILKK